MPRAAAQSDQAEPALGATGPDDEGLRIEVALAIAAHGGNLRDTIASLIVLTQCQQRQIERLEAVASVGYMRGKQPKPPE
jgi:hypothetical protein